MRTHFIVGVLLSLAALCAASARAQPPVPSPTTAVLVNLTVRPDADRAEIVKIMPDEVRATVQLYLDGKIQQWFARSDGRGVMFILNVTDTAAAKGLMEGLPLSKANLATFEYTGLGPLSPLRYLMGPAPAPKPAAAAKDDPALAPPGPDGMMIVPVGEKERETIVRESSGLVEQVERAIGYQPRQ